MSQPYDKNRNVVQIEQWHWSYKPLSSQITNQHMRSVTVEDIMGREIKGENTIFSNFDFYHRGFVSDINSDCLV